MNNDQRSDVNPTSGMNNTTGSDENTYTQCMDSHRRGEEEIDEGECTTCSRKGAEKTQNKNNTMAPKGHYCCTWEENTITKQYKIFIRPERLGDRSNCLIEHQLIQTSSMENTRREHAPKLKHVKESLTPPRRNINGKNLQSTRSLENAVTI